MPLFLKGDPCAFCDDAMTARQHLIGFPKHSSSHPLLELLDAAVVHRRCLSLWEHRDAFVRAWNREAVYSLGSRYLIEVTRRGTARHLTWFGRQCWLRGFKRSALLPKLIRQDRPLLLLQLRKHCPPLRLQIRFGQGAAYPHPEEIGASAETAEAMRIWHDNYGHVKDGVWWENLAQCRTEGRRLWNRLRQQLGNRYHVVYDEGGQIFEPDVDFEPQPVDEFHHRGWRFDKTTHEWIQDRNLASISGVLKPNPEASGY